jgi:hypothetical protein
MKNIKQTSLYSDSKKSFVCFDTEHFMLWSDRDNSTKFNSLSALLYRILIWLDYKEKVRNSYLITFTKES